MRFLGQIELKVDGSRYVLGLANTVLSFSCSRNLNWLYCGLGFSQFYQIT